MRAVNKISATLAMVLSPFLCVGDPHAAPSKIWVRLTGKAIVGNERFKGTGYIGLVSRKGMVSGKLNSGISCKGTVRINIFFSRGRGHIRCGKLTMNYKFVLTSRIPPKGVGSGVSSNGKKVSFQITPYK